MSITESRALRAARRHAEFCRASDRYRERRHRVFEALVGRLPAPVRILDVGGTPEFWAARRSIERLDLEIVLLNLELQETSHPRISAVAGSATDLSRYADRAFDVVFSNSVIEHLFTFENQRAMASEIRRVGKAYWVQTPSFWFPLEPHFRIVGWQWLPKPVRVAILRRFRCGHRGPLPRAEAAARSVEEVRLLTRREMQLLFSGARIWRERACGLVKSYVAYSGFGVPGPGS